MCLYPKLIKNRKYLANKKNGGEIPPIKDQRVIWVPIGCQKCMECQKQKARGWQVRLLEDIKTQKHGKFVTLTFSNESIKELTDALHNWKITKPKRKKYKPWPLIRKTKKIPKLQIYKGYDLDNAIATRAVKLFLGRWRKQYGKSVRHWLVTELGHQGTEHLHIHGIIWTKEPIEAIDKIWKYGWTFKGEYNARTGKYKNYVNAQTVNYCVKYVHKQDQDHAGYKPIVLCSAGIGDNYTKTWNSTLHKYNHTKTNELYRTEQGFKIAIPIYWRNKIYSDNEREQLWLYRLDKEERYVCGEKVSVKHEMQSYYRLLEWHRRRNAQLGYGQPQEWHQYEYENNQRQLKINERISAFGEKFSKRDRIKILGS